MFAYLLAKFCEWLERAAQRRSVDFLVCAADLGDLERRMRVLERQD
ncbi:MAG TPA: DUF3563 domain-containing protein [Paraburkholderia sp.]|jgi:hypothetical protein|nr:DUF3563 domain-containing protein [Paraburkholderia sp.]